MALICHREIVFQVALVTLLIVVPATGSPGNGGGGFGIAPKIPRTEKDDNGIKGINSDSRL